MELIHNMIVKSWNRNSPEFDKTFDLASSNFWNAWCVSRRHCDLLDEKAFIDIFHFKPITNDYSYDRGNAWAGLIFEDEAQYMLFLLEWS